MSELREIEIPVDEAVFLKTAAELGMPVDRHAPIRGYATTGLTGKLVARGVHEDIGIHNGKLVYDNMSPKANIFLSKYMDNYISTKLKGIRLEKKETKQQIVYTARI